MSREARAEESLGPERAADLNQILRDLAVEYTGSLRQHLGDSLWAVVLYGSVARGEAAPGSDIDLLIVASGMPRARLARHSILEQADRLSEPRLQTLRKQGIVVDICPILKTPDEAERTSPLYLDLVEDAMILYERDGFFSAILGRLRASLRRLGARRIRRGRIRYWELKPDYVPGEVFQL